MNKKIEEALRDFITQREKSKELENDANSLVICAHSKRLDAHSVRILAEAEIMFLDVVIKEFGKFAGVEWTDKGVIVNGEEYKQNDSCDGKVVEIDGKKYQLKIIED